MNTYTEIRHLSGAALRRLCIEQNWYTRGDNDEYEHLLIDLAERKENLTTADIIELATDIAEHSDLDDVEPEADVVAIIAFEVARITVSRFVEEVRCDD